MFQRFASALFGDDVSRLPGPGQCEEDQEEEVEEDEDWILVDYLAVARTTSCGVCLPGAPTGPAGEDEEDEEEDLVMIPSPMATPTLRYASCISLNSMADTDESWFVTPPPCFTGRGSKNVLLETSPLENLLIEHPSMSVYAHHSPPRLNLNPLPRSLNLELDRNLGLARPTCPSPGKEKGRRSLDKTRHRPEAADGQRGPSLHVACYTAALQQQAGSRLAQRATPLSRNAMRRLNLLCHPPTSKQRRARGVFLHQPSHRHLNY
ncbi:hypothetical protein NHX12_001168 [Muraenolepis orangiensis]|uniref:Tumor protein p53-inducible nuclear protein 1 n=1 Tax=Muraenolepis orangiensis TaxID=630683 RepID=A0A9Q0DZY6_9TELE|nr:hypothetical protein NHX12_001168 [Muraenolepis orangiensis]